MPPPPPITYAIAGCPCHRLLQQQASASCFEAILHRDLGHTWVNFFRLASVRLAPLDVNVDVALLAALVEAACRVAELVVEVCKIMNQARRWSCIVRFLSFFLERFRLDACLAFNICFCFFVLCV